MKIISIASFCVGIPFVFAILFFSFAPEPRTNAVVESWRRLKHDHGQLCLDYTREKLKDPGSIRLIKWHEDSKRIKTTNSYVVLTYKATNSYGAYVEGSSICYVNSMGVDRTLSDKDWELDVEYRRLTNP